MTSRRKTSKLVKQLKPYIQESASAASAISSSGVTDHGLLTGLYDDDHPQYLTTPRGDARYIKTGEAPAVAAHGIVDGSYHTAVGNMFDVIGLTAPNVLGVLVPEDDVSGSGNTLIMSDANGDITVRNLGATGTVDGVDVSAHAAAINPHNTTLASLITKPHSALTDVNDDDHHNPITVGDNLTLSTQHLTLGTDVALKDIDNQFQVSQSITGGLTATGDVAADDLQATTYGRIGGSLVVGAIDAPRTKPAAGPDYTLDVRGDSIIEDIIGDDAEFNHLKVIDLVFEYKSTVVSGGAQRWVPGGANALYEALTLTAGQSSISVPVKDREIGHYKQFYPGDKLLISGLLGVDLNSGTNGNAFISEQAPESLWFGMAETNTDAVSIWVQVNSGPTSITDNDTHYSYACTAIAGQTIPAGTFPVGTSVASYGQPSASDPVGYIEIAANQGPDSPNLSIWKIEDDVTDPDPIVFIGQLNKVTEAAGDNSFGFAWGTDLNTSTASRIIMGDDGLDMSLADDGGKTVVIDDETGINLYHGQNATRRLSFRDVAGEEVGWLGNSIGTTDLYGEIENWGSIDLTAKYVTDEQYYPTLVKTYDDQGNPTGSEWKDVLANEGALLNVRVLGRDGGGLGGLYLAAGGPAGFEQGTATIGAKTTAGIIAPEVDIYANDTFKLSAGTGTGERGYMTMAGGGVNWEMPRSIAFDAPEMELTASTEFYVVGGTSPNQVALTITDNTFKLTGLPISSAGLATGALYSDSGTIKIVT